MTTALDLITGAAKLIGVLNKGENMAADDAADGLVSLNDMIESWSNNGLLVYARTIETFSLVAGTASYTMGTGQTWNTTRPIRIISAQIRDGANLDFPVKIINDEEYYNVQDKGSQSPYPEYLNFSNAHPYPVIKFWGTPSQAYTARLVSEKVLSSFALTSTTVDLPSGWKRAIRFNLAVEMAPEYGVKVDPVVLDKADESLGLIKSAVLKTRPLLSTDPSWLRR